MSFRPVVDRESPGYGQHTFPPGCAQSAKNIFATEKHAGLDHRGAGYAWIENLVHGAEPLSENWKNESVFVE